MRMAYANHIRSKKLINRADPQLYFSLRNGVQRLSDNWF